MAPNGTVPSPNPPGQTGRDEWAKPYKNNGEFGEFPAT